MSSADASRATLSVLVVLALFALAALSVLRPRRALGGAGVHLLRCLWPSWRFFDVVAPPPQLRFRLLADSSAADTAVTGAWQSASVPEPRSWLSLFVDARGNLELAYGTLAERLLEELDGCSVERAQELVSYRLVRRQIEARLRELGHVGACYQFSLNDAGSDEALFVSVTHGAELADDLVAAVDDRARGELTRRGRADLRWFRIQACAF